VNIDPELEARILAAPGTLVNGRPVATPEPPSFGSEKQFMAEVMKLLKEHRWRTYHTHDSRKSNAGFPDIVAVRGRRVLWIELKTEEGRVSAAQQNWIDDLVAAGQKAFVLRPSQWEELVRLVRS
jgi:hypothetical protein